MTRKLSKEQLAATEPWIRNRNDEWAIDEGCWWDLERAAYHVYWVENNCALYEGVYSGQKLILHSIADQPEMDVPVNFYDEAGEPIPEVLEFYRDRFEWHNDLRDSGEFMHFHFECAARMYGWQRPDSRFAKFGINQVRRFTKGAVWCSKKNTKSPILAKDILYITMADGEEGMKSFICAKDGGQAGISWNHAFFMIKQSESLSDNCEPNMATKRVVYRPTNSWFEPLSSANKRVQDAKEGLNGSVFVDEVHTVDREFMSIVEFAGASRVQPVQWMYSTAGKNPESYGKQMWDYGESVVAGDIRDTRYFHQSYHAPQDLTVEQFEADPEKYIRMANPSLGLTVDYDEIMGSWNQAKKSKYDTVKFFLYRLNIWSNASEAWLAHGVWSGCGGWTFDNESLLEAPCVIGFDNAKVKDMASAVFAWRNELGGVDLRPMFWCNEHRIQQISAIVPKILDWVDAGLIHISPGNTNDASVIKRQLHAEIQKWNVAGFVHDPWYCDDIVAFLVDGETDKAGEYTYEPVLDASQVVPMSQGIATQTGPTTMFEADLLEKKIRHESHAVLDWQFSHANVKEDARGNIVIQKENRESFRTVDGCQAAVMARWGALDYPDFHAQILNSYEEFEEGLEF